MEINLTNSQTPIVVSEDTTALNDRNYTVIEDAVFTDPTPIEGKGFKVFVRNGTAEIGGISYIVGSLVFRIHYDGSWLNVKIDQTLTQTLEKGNETLGFDIILTELDRIIVGVNRAGLSKGTYNTGRGGDKGVSLICANDLELNWQSGFLRNMVPDGDGTPLALNSDSEIVYTELVPTTPTYGKSLVTKDYTDTKFPNPTGTTAQYIRGDGSLDTFPTIPDVTGLQSKAVVVSTNQTAVNDASYTVVANATFTDPSPVEGKGYRVFVRNGTATINSVGYAEGTTIFRLFHSGAWVSYVSLPDSNFVPYTGATGDVDLGNNDLNAEGIKIKGTAGNGHLNLKHQSSGASAGGSESVIYADSSGNPRWKNDGNALQSIMLENSAITGATKTKITYDAKGLVTAGADLTSSDVLGFLGWFKTTVTTNYSVTGTTGETIASSTQLPTLSNGTIFKINTLRFTKGALAGSTIRAYLSPNSGNISGAIQILSTGSVIVAGARLATISRVFEIEGGNIKGLNAFTGVLNDNSTSTVATLDAALPSGTLYLIVTVTNSLSTETTTQELLDISNF